MGRDEHEGFVVGLPIESLMTGVIASNARVLASSISALSSNSLCRSQLSERAFHSAANATTLATINTAMTHLTRREESSTAA